MTVKIINKSDNNLPAYETSSSAGMDLRAYLPEGPITLKPMQRTLVPTGLFMEIPEGYEGQRRGNHHALHPLGQRIRTEAERPPAEAGTGPVRSGRGCDCGQPSPCGPAYCSADQYRWQKPYHLHNRKPRNADERAHRTPSGNKNKQEKKPKTIDKKSLIKKIIIIIVILIVGFIIISLLPFLSSQVPTNTHPSESAAVFPACILIPKKCGTFNISGNIFLNLFE